MTTATRLWIKRQAADEIYEEIRAKPAGLHILIVNAPAGVGKTYLGRDIGTRLGSDTGYEAGHKDDIYWSGIVDLYDPDTSNSKHIERRWIQAYSSLTGFEFHGYQRQRDLYESMADEFALPSMVEKQIDEIRNAFAEGMEKAVENFYPVMAFDTVERLQTVLDPVQQKLNLQEIDPSDVFGWFLYQIQRLPKGTLLMLGRSTPVLSQELQRRITDINSHRKTRGLEPVEIEVILLNYLNSNEQNQFFNQRASEQPGLQSLLDEGLKSLLIKHTEGNPLLLDIAIQTLLETRDPEKVRSALGSTKGIKAVEEALLTAYMQFGSAERQSLLTYLAIARNGLSEHLLKNLDPKHFSELYKELTRMGNLPFVKVRDISMLTPGQEQRTPQRTYFLHDEMYAICDRVGLIRLKQIQEDSRKIVNWYENQIQQHQQFSTSVDKGQRLEAIRDLLAESLPYRMRADPESGYRWYLAQSDRAIRASERELDLHLRDAMSQFIGSAEHKGRTGELPASAIDREILVSQAFHLYQDFLMDSTLQWIKRYSVRGRHEKALDIAQKAIWVKENFANNRQLYLVTYAELLLWLGQSTMYVGKSWEALNIYNEITNDFGKVYTPETIKSKLEQNKISSEDASRICLIAGRVYNNRGYLYWMYMGKYWAAIEEFHEAIRSFELVNLPEEMANSKDSLGRVFAILGFNFPAFEAIREGLQLRTLAEIPYREALSRNSLAIAYARFDNATQALQEVEVALKTFRQIRIERGVALAQITRGMARRIQAELWRDLGLTVPEALALVKLAETDLLDALRMFSEVIQEPIRKAQICNELACCYRSSYFLLLRGKTDPEELKKAFERGISYFAFAVEVAKNNGFLIEKLDSLQDRAVLYARAGQFDKARADLEEVRSFIPATHKIKLSEGLFELEKLDRVDAYYKLMGQVELLTGAIVFNEARQTEEIPSREIALKTIEHYILAVAYFNVFSSESFTNRQTSSRIYSRLRGYDRKFLIELRDELVPNIIGKYKLPQEAVRGQFDEVFGLLIPGSRAQKWERSSRR